MSIICQAAYFELKRVSSIRSFLTEDTSKTLVSSYNRQIYIYISSKRLDYCNCLLMGTPDLASNLQPLQKFKTLVQDSFSWHPATTTQHLSCGKWTGFPFHNVLNTKSLVCVSMLNMVLVLLTSLTCYVSTLCLVHNALLLKNKQYKRKIHGFRTFSCFGLHSWNSLPQD